MRVIVFIGIVTLLVACGGRGKAKVEAVEQGQVVALSDSIVEHRRADTIDFGRLRAGELATREFVLRNDGDKALVVIQVDLSCGCVSADYPREPLMPGGQAPMSLTLDTKDLRGWVFKTVGVRTSLAARPYTLCITAEVE
jgi:hypothetical protein